MDGTVSLWVHDSGPGVPVDQAQRIFERFIRGRPATDGSGAGLGLSIVRAIAEAHGGTARLDAAAADGARFVIELPADDRGP